MENVVMDSSLTQYYEGKKIFITGHTGFKGSWLIACLHNLGGIIKGYALEPEYKNGLFDLLQGLHLCESVIEDIRSKARLKQEITTFQPDYIFHLAAQPLVRRSYKIPAETFEVNVVGTANLLEAVNSLSKRCTIIIVTTDKVYENKEHHSLYREGEPLGGFDPYSASKACVELVVSSFRKSFFDPNRYDSHQKAIASARAGNVIGGGDWSEDRIIPDIIRSLQQKKTVQVRNPDAVRPWQHVLEPLAGYLWLAAHLQKNPGHYGKAYNFGPSSQDHLTVRELVESAIRLWGNGNWHHVENSLQPHEAGLLRLDIRLAKNELNWQPKLNADTAIKWTVDWYKKPVTEQANFALQQIREYFAL